MTPQECIRAEHEYYIRNISTPQMAMSCEAALDLFGLMDDHRPRALVDFGSGFSSFVLRWYAREIDPRALVCSVDDDVQWLGKTRDFLRYEGLNLDLMFTLDEFLSSNYRDGFDLVFYDLGNLGTRISNLPVALDALAFRGTIVFDDMHKPTLAQAVREELRERNWSLISRKKETLDKFGRFVEIAHKT